MAVKIAYLIVRLRCQLLEYCKLSYRESNQQPRELCGRDWAPGVARMRLCCRGGHGLVTFAPEHAETSVPRCLAASLPGCLRAGVCTVTSADAPPRSGGSTGREVGAGFRLM